MTTLNDGKQTNSEVVNVSGLSSEGPVTDHL